MRRLLGHLILGVSLSVVFASIGAGEAKAGPAYAIDITIVDNTTHVTNTFPIAWSSASNTAFPANPNLINVNAGTFSTASTGVALTGINALTMSTGQSTSLTTQATATIQDSSTDSYTVTITTVNNGFTQPVGNPGDIFQSTAGTYTSAGAGNTQTFQSWYNGNNIPSQSGPTPGPFTFGIPAGPATASPTNSQQAVFSPFTEPYALTQTLTLNVTGNGTPNNVIASISGTTIVTAVPEPASLVMFLTGMPMPLVVLGMLRRRKAQRAA